ncbi:MAG: S8 family serine peptidase [Rhodobacteraceae bacterium]|nr:S8 family serine peptidase [Paracoccaceae bacterium]
MKKSFEFPSILTAGRHLLCASVLALGALPAVAQDQAPPGGPTLLVADGLGGVQPGDGAALMARAQQAGVLVVIVGFDAAFQPEGQLDADGVTAQRDGIAAAQERVLAGLEAPQSVTRFATIPFLSVVVAPDDLDRLLSMPGITSISEDVPVPPQLNQSVPLIGGNRMRRAGFGGTGWTVAVLDTGTQLNHRAFSGGAIIEGACYSLNVAGQSTSLCPNGQNSQTGRAAAAACDPALDGCLHGTHVAGIAMGDRRRRLGVAPDANLIGIQVFSRFDSDAQCGAGQAPCVLSYSTDQVQGLERVLFLNDAPDGPRIASANMSLGGGQFFDYCDATEPARTAAIANLLSRNIATVIASGNSFFDGAVGTPGCIRDAITVGNTTKTDDIAPSSNHARMVDLMAPGTDISAPRLSATSRNQVISLTGTSMASPHVAGTWAVLRQAHPDATVAEILEALACTGTLVARNNLPLPRINVFAAHQYLDSPIASRTWTFRNDRQVGQWQQHLGVWFRPAGQNLLRVLGSQPQAWNAATSPFCSRNLRVDATVRRVDPDQDTNWNSGMVLFATIDDTTNVRGMWFAFNKMEGGNAVIWALDGYNFLTNSGAARLLCDNPNVGVNVGGNNAIRIISQNGTHRFLLNGTEVCSATDGSFPPGLVGVVMAGPGSDASHIYDVSRVAARTLGGGGATLVAGGDADSAVPTNLDAYRRAPDGDSLEVAPGVSPLGVVLSE